MMNRRQLIRKATLSAGALALGRAVKATEQALRLPGNQPFHHSACRWCYNDIPLEELCERGQDLGLKSIELLKPDEWPIAQQYGLTCAVGTADFASITDGFNNRRNHARLQEQYIPLIRAAADAGLPHVICFSGNRNGMKDNRGLEHCARGLEPLVREAESVGITIVMELLNSKVDHIDYMCDHTDWGVELVNKIGSPNFRLLYDIYHMQIMEGDVIRTIREQSEFIAHFHTGGVPGRHEINATQELNYPAIVQAIADTGYTGFIGQEFIPTYEDKLHALAEGIGICSID